MLKLKDICLIEIDIPGALFGAEVQKDIPRRCLQVHFLYKIRNRYIGTPLTENTRMYYFAGPLNMISRLPKFKRWAHPKSYKNAQILQKKQLSIFHKISADNQKVCRFYRMSDRQILENAMDRSAGSSDMGSAMRYNFYSMLRELHISKLAFLGLTVYFQVFQFNLRIHATASIFSKGAQGRY